MTVLPDSSYLLLEASASGTERPVRLVLAVPLLAANKNYTMLQSAFFGFSAAVGFTLVIILFAAMRERLATADIPKPFKGTAISLVTAGLMSLAFMGFTGLTQN